MVELKFRRIDFRFDTDIPFYFNPGDPGTSHFVNMLSMVAPAFERYVVRATRDAMPAIRDERTRQQADLFCRQEAQHAKLHSDHLRLLTDRYPALEETRRAVNDSYDRLYESEPMEFHLAYAATLELFFGPSAQFIIENRDDIFDGGDPRISSLVLWHFVEEFEHRNCAIDVFDDVVGSHWFRLRKAPRILGHLAKVGRIGHGGLARLVEAGLEPEASAVPFSHTSKARRARVAYQFLCTFSPYHRPDNLRQPDWATQWLADEAAGKDMGLYYPGGTQAGSGGRESTCPDKAARGRQLQGDRYDP